jgi:lysozyme
MLNAISAAGVGFIKSWEKFSAVPYDDGYGYMTIGYGHKIKPGETFTSITEPEACALLTADLQPFVTIVNNALFVTQSQQQFDALVSFEYNTGAFPSSTLCRVINEGGSQPDAIRSQFMRWTNAAGRPSQGLVNRRTAEVAVYMDGNYVRTT